MHTFRRVRDNFVFDVQWDAQTVECVNAHEHVLLCMCVWRYYLNFYKNFNKEDNAEKNYKRALLFYGYCFNWVKCNLFNFNRLMTFIRIWTNFELKSVFMIDSQLKISQKHCTLSLHNYSRILAEIFWNNFWFIA